MNFELEICANSVASCIEAEKGGATRVELCMGIPEGGTTPSAGMIKQAVNSIKIPVHVIIRPRGGDFLYTDEELKEMLYDIEVAKNLGAKGVVFGCLTKDGNYDAKANKLLLDAAKGLQITFHRAFDVCADPHKLLDEIINAGGFTRVLTSGWAATAPEGAEMIKSLVAQADDRIGIMAGCGVRPNNLARLAKESGTNMFHSSLRTTIPSKMEFRKDKVSMGGVVQINEFEQNVTSCEEVQKAVKILKEL